MPKNYWLVKSEPFVYSYEDLEREGRVRWDGVRNYAARNHLREMKLNDQVLFYHSREGLKVVGVAKVVKEHYPDPGAEKGDWSAVDLAPLFRLKAPVSLKTIKAIPELQDLPLVRIGRLSVMPVEKAAFDRILALGEH
jgi:predicted RNA-binding protein with PUA-like domain